MVPCQVPEPRDCAHVGQVNLFPGDISLKVTDAVVTEVIFRNELIGPASTPHPVVPSVAAADQPVVAGIAAELVAAVAAIEHVVARATVEAIDIFVAPKPVVPGPTLDRVAPAAAPDDVGPGVDAPSMKDTGSQALNRLEGSVTYVRDGDTVLVQGTPVRIANVDCAERGTVEGQRATLRMTQLAEMGPFRCCLEGRRSYDREVGLCALPTGQDVGEILITEGQCRRWR